LLRIQRAVLLELLGVFALALLVVTGTLFTGRTLQTMSQMQGLQFQAVLALLPSILPVALAYALPYAFLLAVAFTYGRMVSDRELVALRVSGVHPRVVVAPVVGVGTVLSLALFASFGWLIPGATQEFRMQQRNFPDLFLAALGGSDAFITFRQFRLSFSSYEPGEQPGGLGVFRDFELDQRDEEGNLVRKILGEEARLRRDGDDLVLETPFAWLFMEKGRPETGPRKVTVGDPVSVGPGGTAAGGKAKNGGGAGPGVSVGSVEGLGAATSFKDALGNKQFERKAKDVELPDLLYMVERGDLPKVPRFRSLVELHARLAGALTPLVFGLVAAAVCLNLSVRSRRLLGFLLAFLPTVLVHFPLALAGKSLAESQRVAPWIGMWLADAVLLLGAGVLLRRAYVR
jgi:lipopolysaccharide export LptBFGC system permease protein LptF